MTPTASEMARGTTIMPCRRSMLGASHECEDVSPQLILEYTDDSDFGLMVVIGIIPS